MRQRPAPARSGTSLAGDGVWHCAAGSSIQALGQLHAHLERLALPLGLDMQQHSLAGVEDLAGVGEHVGEHDGLELAGLVRDADEGEEVAGFGSPLALHGDDASEDAGAGGLGGEHFAGYRRGADLLNNEPGGEVGDLGCLKKRQSAA